MALKIVKTVAPAVLALGIAGSGAGLGLGSATAWAASTHSPKAATLVKVGATCTKADQGKTIVKQIKRGKLGLVCEKSGTAYKWEIKPAKKMTATAPKTGAVKKK